MSKISVVIATHNRAQSLAKCLAALAKFDYPMSELEVIVSDNASSDATEAVAEGFKKVFPNFAYLFDPRPGQLVGWHRGLAAAKSEIVAFIDDDIRPIRSWASAIEETFNDAAIGLATGKIIPEFLESPPDWHQHLVRPHK
ncbi:MAG: glycosyltransferase family 2 protein, partial [Rhodospirillales bacterium]|nr:glycosyltransferase family 2 protein [Rhodospirillales bacterium]